MPRNTATDKRYSVCIGINIYAPEAGLGPLNYAENDARGMDEMLGKLGFAPENRVLLLGKDATFEAVNEQLGTTIYDRAKENDLVVVYFAGHSTPVTIEGRPEARRSEVFLATFDFNRQRIQNSLFFRTQYALGMERLRRTFFEGQGSRKRLFIFDSCYSGDFYGPSYRDGTDQVPGYVQHMLNSSTAGRIFIASCLPYQKALESSVHGHGYFTYYLLQALGGEASEALRRDGTLTAGSLFDYLDDKLQDQKPVKGGVEFGSFELARFSVPSITGTERILEDGGLGKEARLKAMQTDQHDFVQDRLQRFVGRQTELTELQRRIAGKMERGGYVVITSDAGQGKSSIIAKLIADQGIDSSAYHFIQFGSGANYPINLLRNLMARLILKYDLPEDYVKGESYPILCGNFLGVLKAIAEKGEQEVIYIDGLDQLEMDSSAAPNLSFLPSRLPLGIVIVVGTRPNTTFDQLILLTQSTPDDVYALPGLSREDFDLLLQHHSVSLLVALRDSLHRRLHQNPLYLDLVAQELRAPYSLQPEELIARVANNPNNIFTITFSRMQRSPDEWYNVVRPILGILLVAQEPLTAQQIAHISNQGEARISAGIRDLGGLLTLAGKQRYTLFHPKLNEYLKLDSRDPGNGIQFAVGEVRTLHGQVARWCEQEPIEQLWSDFLDPSSLDDYQKYAQKHYITHLYEAGSYERLFAVLNEGSYERGKLRFDPSTRSSAVDLKLGCQAAAHGARTLEEGKGLLAHLWRYTLLRTNLTTRADAYPIEAFQALLALGREREALNLAELLTQPASKLAVLILITEYLLKEPSREAEGLQLSNRVYEIAMSTQHNDTQTGALSGLTRTFVHTGRLVQAEDIARLIAHNDEQAAVFNDISDAYGKQGNWHQAKVVAYLITIDEERVRALSHLAIKLKLADEAAEAEALWQEASTTASAIADSKKRSRAIYHLSVSFMRAKEWERAKTAARSIESNGDKISALCQLALSFTREGLAAQAETAWEEAKIAIVEIDEQDKAYRIYAIAQAQAGLYAEAEYTASRYLASNPTEKIIVFSSLVSNLVRESLWNDGKRIIDLIVKEYDLTDVDPSLLDTILIRLSIDLARGDQWDLAGETAHAIPRKEAQCRALMGIVSELAWAGLSETAQAAWEEARAMCTVQTDAVQASVTGILVSVLVEVGQIAQAKQIISTLPDKQTQEYITEKLAIALARAGRIAEAEEIAHGIISPMRKDTVHRSIALAQIKAGLPEQAIETLRGITHVERQSQALVDLVTTCCQMHEWDRARQIADQIRSDHLQADALSRVIVGLVRVGKITEAEAIARSIGNEFLKANVICDLATILAQTGYVRDADRVARSIRSNPRIQGKALSNIAMVGLFGASSAESIARAIDKSNEREEALCNVAIAYARENSWDEAENVAEEISDEQKRDEAWAAIARERAEVGQWTQAVTALDKIHRTKQRLAVLQAWGTPLVQLASKEVREQIEQHLSDSEEKASLLVSIADALAQADRYLEQIHLTQQAWLQVSTKDDCQDLFVMVRGLLPHNPEMCTHFYESFGWVDAFLNK